MSGAISAALRRLVTGRARGLCEYCLIHQDDAHFSFHVDHIISRKHRGPSSEGNLALSCLRCNVAKGTDVGALAGRDRSFVRLFHPREDSWPEHFRLASARIVPLTQIGAATAQLLALNASDRLLLRRALVAASRYPSAEARAYLQERTN